MNLRWVIATVGCLALALLTLNASPDLHFDRVDADGPATAACPATAKPANMNFTLKDVEGKDVKLAALKGKVVLLDFWATWCGPCKIEIPWFVEFQNKYGKQGLQVVGVSVDDTPAKLKPYVAQMKMNYPVLQGLDHDDIQDAYGPLFGIPVTIVISRDGKMCAKHVGLSSKDRFEAEIKSLLKYDRGNAEGIHARTARLRLPRRVSRRRRRQPRHGGDRSQVARMHAAAARARSADVRLPRGPASVDPSRPPRRRRVRRGRLSAGPLREQPRPFFRHHLQTIDFQPPIRCLRFNAAVAAKCGRFR